MGRVVFGAKNVLDQVGFVWKRQGGFRVSECLGVWLGQRGSLRL